MSEQAQRRSCCCYQSRQLSPAHEAADGPHQQVGAHLQQQQPLQIFQLGSDCATVFSQFRHISPKTTGATEPFLEFKARVLIPGLLAQFERSEETTETTTQSEDQRDGAGAPGEARPPLAVGVEVLRSPAQLPPGPLGHARSPASICTGDTASWVKAAQSSARNTHRQHAITKAV